MSTKRYSEDVRRAIRYELAEAERIADDVIKPYLDAAWDELGPNASLEELSTLTRDKGRGDRVAAVMSKLPKLLAKFHEELAAEGMTPFVDSANQLLWRSPLPGVPSSNALDALQAILLMHVMRGDSAVVR